MLYTTLTLNYVTVSIRYCTFNYNVDVFSVAYAKGKKGYPTVAFAPITTPISNNTCKLDPIEP